MFSDLFYQLWDKGEFLRAIWETVYMTLLSRSWPTASAFRSASS